MIRGGCIYFLTNEHHTVIYIGVTSNLPVRLLQHQSKEYKSAFTAKYNRNKLVYYEAFHLIEEAIAREKALKKWNREWKERLVSEFNPQWKNLAEEVMKG
jgi:putative endonuclease